MSDRDDDPQPKRLIYSMAEHVQTVRNNFWEQSINGRPNEQTKRRLAAAAVEYWDVLYEHRNESVLNEGDFPDIEPVKQRLGKQIEASIESAGRKRGNTTKLKPAIVEVDDWYLVNLTKQLDDCRKKLGLAASVTDRPDTFGVDPDYEEGDA
jgi:hypothetical protein